jgi:hypothetical protein
MDATVELTDIEASVELKYDLSGVGFTFPPQDNAQGGSFTPGTNRESPALLLYTPFLSFPFLFPWFNQNRLSD